MVHVRALVVASACASFALLAGACGDPAPPATSDTSDTTDDDGPPAGRSFFLGGWAEGYSTTGASRRVFSLDPLQVEVPDGDGAELEADADVGEAPDPFLVEAIVVPLDVYGVPWEAFDVLGETPQELPAAWLKAVTDAVEAARETGRPLALALSPVGEAFDQLAPRATEDAQGQLQLQTQWSGFCYDPNEDGNPTKWRQAYGKYAAYLARQFAPRWVFVAQRINLYEASCPDSNPSHTGAYAGVAGFATEAHERIKALATPPTTVVTVDVEDLYNFPRRPGRCVGQSEAACLASRAPLLEVFTADRLGLESYPAIALPSVGALPADWLSAVADASPRPTLVAGTGLPAVRIERQQGACVPLVESSETVQLTWLDQVLATAQARQMELVVWRSPVDLLPAAVVASCPCTGDASLCQHLSQLGARADEIRLRTITGLVATDGTERAAAGVWRGLLD